jgi:hypothetical protein
MDTAMAERDTVQGGRLLKAAELANADAMQWEAHRIKVAISAVAIVGGITAFAFRHDVDLPNVRRAASILVAFIGLLSFGLVGRCTQSFGQGRARAKAYYKAWLRERDEAYARFKEQEKRRPIVVYYLQPLPLSQLVLTAVGIYLFCSTY